MKSIAVRILLVTSTLMFMLGAWSLVPAPASSYNLQSTPLPMPTPGADGRILYTVQAGDSQWLIAAKFNINIEELRRLNNWTAEEALTEGQVILLGTASQTEPTPTAGPTSEVVATQTPTASGAGEICVLLFDDFNGDALRQETEFGIPNGQASVSERTGLASQTGTTVANIDVDGLPVPVCFPNLPIGEYTVSVAAPQGFNATTAQSATIQLNPGDATSLNFGAQASSSSGFNVLSPEEGGRSPLMGLLGVVLILGGAGLGAFTWQVARRRR